MNPRPDGGRGPSLLPTEADDEPSSSRAADRHGRPAVRDHPDLARGARPGYHDGALPRRVRLGAVAGLRPRPAGAPQHAAAWEGRPLLAPRRRGLRGLDEL